MKRISLILFLLLLSGVFLSAGVQSGNKQLESAEDQIKRLLELVKKELKNGNPEAAMKLSRDAYECCISALKKDTASASLNELLGQVTGSISGLSSKTARTRTYIYLYEKDLKRQGNLSQTYSMYLCSLISELYRNVGSLDTALFYSGIALKKAESTNNILFLARIKGSLAVTYFKMGRYNEALSQALSAEEMLVSLKNTEYLAPLYNNIATIYQKNYNLAEASLYFIKSLKIKEKMKDSIGIANTLNNLGVVYESWGDTLNALKYFHKAKRMNISLKNIGALSYTYNNLGTIYLDMKKPDSALHYFGKALELKRELNDDYGVMMILESLGLCYMNLLDMPEVALEKYSEARRLAIRSGASYWKAILDLDIGEIYVGNGKNKEGVELLEQALDYAKREEQFDMVQRASKLLLLEAADRGDNKLVKQRFLDYLLASDSVIAREKSDLTAELLARYESEKKDHENLILRKENDIKKLNISSKNQQLFALGGLVFFLVIFAVVTLFLYRKRVQAYRMLVKKNLEIVKAEAFLTETGKLPESLPGEGSAITDSGFRPASVNGDHGTELTSRLLSYFKQEKPYLSQELSLDDICRHLHTNRTYLSAVINDGLKKNFTAFLSEYRVAEARRLLADSKNNRYTIEEIGRMAGFGATTTFHQHFKAQIGVTPAFFRNYSGNEN